MAAVGGAGLLQLSCSTGKLRGAPDVPAGDRASVAGGATASQSTASPPAERFRPIIDRYLPLPRILHPEPGVRFDAKHPRYSPYALKFARTDLCWVRPVT